MAEGPRPPPGEDWAGTAPLQLLRVQGIQGAPAAKRPGSGKMPLVFPAPHPTPPRLVFRAPLPSHLTET